MINIPNYFEIHILNAKNTLYNLELVYYFLIPALKINRIFINIKYS